MFTNIKKFYDIIERQQRIEHKWQSYLKSSKYNFLNPKIVLNPYRTSPLVAVIIFTTIRKVCVKVSVYDEKNLLLAEFKEDFPCKKHIIAIAGLVVGRNNVILESQINNVKLKKHISIVTKVRQHDLGVFQLQSYMNNGFFEIYDKYHLIIDGIGRIRWLYSDISLINVSTLLRNGHRIIANGGYHENDAYLYEVDLFGKVYGIYQIPHGAHHCCFEMEDGNFLVCTNSYRSDCFEDCIVEISRKTGEIHRTIDLKSVLPIPRFIGPYLEQKFKDDIYHVNSVCTDFNKKNIYISCRNQNAIICIDYKTLKLKWVFANNEGWDKYIEEILLKPEGEDFTWFAGQHNIQIHESTYENIILTVFDNGFGRDKCVKNLYSRGIIYKINFKTKTVKKLYEYGKELNTTFYSPKRGNIDLCDNNCVIISSTSIENTKSELEEAYDMKSITYIVDLNKSIILNQLQHYYKSCSKQVYQIHYLSDINWIKQYKNFEQGKLYFLRGLKKRMIDDTVDVPVRYSIDMIKISNNLLKIKGKCTIDGVKNSKIVKYLSIRTNNLQQFIYKLPQDWTPERNENELALFNSVRIPISDLPIGHYDVWLCLKNIDNGKVIAIDIKKWFTIEK